jgi:hypothetical protein
MYEQKQIEFGTDAARRVYCSDVQCGKFIPLEHIQDGVAVCPDQECRAQTCDVCRGPGHLGDCPHDEALQATLAFAAENRWRRCGRCRTMVELTLGCNHMT